MADGSFEVELGWFWSDYDPPLRRFKPGHWGAAIFGDHRASQLGIFLDMDFTYRVPDLDMDIERLRDCLAGRRAPGWVLANNDGGVAYGGGYLFFQSGYDEDSQVVIAAEVFIEIWLRVRAVILDPGFTDPAASFETMVVPIVAAGPGSVDVYYELGGSTDNVSST